MYRENIVFTLKQSLKERQELIREVDEAIKMFRPGSLVIQNDYAYIKHYEHGKMISTYVGKHLSEEEISNLRRELQNNRTLKYRRKEYVKECAELEKLIHRYEKPHRN